VRVKLLHLLVILFSLTFLHPASSASEAPRLNEILQKHLDAMGGLNNWNQVESLRLSGTIERDGQSFGIVIIKKRPNQIRATVTIPHPNKPEKEIQIIRAHDGKQAWTATRFAGAPEMVKKAITGDVADDLLADAGVLPPLIKLWRESAELELLGTDYFKGELVFVIDAAQGEESSQQRFYLSADSFRTIAREKHTPTEITQTILSDYQKKNGVYLPMHSLITAESTGVSTMQTESIEIGVGIYEEYFEVGEPAQTANL